MRYIGKIRSGMTLVKRGMRLIYFKYILTPIFNCTHKNEYNKISFETDLYSQAINDLNYQKFTVPAWSEWYLLVEAEFLNGNCKFLQNKTIRNTMFVRAGGQWQDIQLKYIESKMYENKMKKLLQENFVGYPTITSFKYNSSHNLIHHLYHLMKFQSETGCDIDKLSTVVEFGGGYGSMCRLIKRLNFNCTYVIIDLPVFSFIQLYYLRSIYGEDQVNILLSDKEEIKSSKINLIPIDESLLEKIKIIEPDLFIATWSLSEANAYTQQFIYNTNFFNSKHILAAYQKRSTTFECAESIKFPQNYKVVYNAKIEYMPDRYHGDYYLFGRRIN